jgi:glycosyltransferase involved in cell wall biosynthesis
MSSTASDQLSLTVIVPAYNEEALVEKSLRRLFVLSESPHLSRIQVVVVDDGSTDGTRDILEKCAAELPDVSDRFEWRFIAHRTNRGKGWSIRTALEHAESDITIVHDADLEYHPTDILRMIPLFIEEGADAVYGSRFTAYEFRRVLFFRHDLGNRFLTFLCNCFSNLNLTDMETCYKAVKTELLKSIPLRSNDFRIEPELTIKLAKRNARIFEIPINYSGRTYPEGKKISWVDGVKALGAIVKFGFYRDIVVKEQ